MPGHESAILIHDTSYVSPLTSISPGCVVMANAFVGPNCDIAEGCILNTGSQIVMMDNGCLFFSAPNHVLAAR